jgi:DNA-binding transcriptional LysR family regulator
MFGREVDKRPFAAITIPSRLIMDRLASMEVFVHVVDLGGFTRAAAASGLSTTMVSNHIRALEQRLGARLLNRTTRRQSLTEIGARYYAQCVDVLARIEAADVEAREMRARPRGRLRVSAPITLGTHLLIPAFAAFLSQQPEVEIDLQLNDRVVNLADEGFDAAFRFGDLPDSGLVARRLRSLGRMICAAPAYLAQHGTPAEPEDLAHHNCLTFYNVQPEREWLFRGANKARRVAVKGQMTINNGSALLEAALAGGGVALLPDYLVDADVAAGRLIRLFPQYDLSRGPLQLVYLPDRHMTPKMRSFVDFVLERLGALT